MATIPNRPEYQSELFKQGLEVRRDVLGAEYVDGSLTRADDFNAAFQQMTTEVAWGMIWTRPGLPRKTRSMINLTMLAALNRGAEFRLHLRAALTNGVTRDEIKEDSAPFQFSPVPDYNIPDSYIHKFDQSSAGQSPVH